VADFNLRFKESATGNVVGQYRPDGDFSFSIRNSEVGDLQFEIALSTTGLTFEQFGPYRTDFELYRTGQSGDVKLLTEGMLTSTNLNNDRDSILVAGKDWLHYLERRVYPFDPVQYVAGNWRNWPQGWPHFASGRVKLGNPVEVKDIIEEMLAKMEAVTLPALPGGVDAGPGMGQLGLIYNNKDTGQTTKYTIMPGDQTTIFEHIQKLSEQVNGFEFDILPGSREFKMWSPGRAQDNPIYRLQLQGEEATGAIIDLDWTNDGPEGTFLVGLGTAEHRAGAVWYYRPSIEKYRWLDKVYDFGEMANTDLLFGMLKDQQDLFPQRKLGITLLNPEFLSPSFYTGGRPRGLIGQKIFVKAGFAPYWSVDSTYIVNAINWNVDASTNESVELELEIVYDDNNEDNLPHGI